MKILAAIDQSDFALRVVDLVGQIANAQTSVLILSVAPREPDMLGQQLSRKVVTEPVPEHLRERWELTQRLAKAFERSQIECSALIVRGKPAPTILDEARRWGADLIVVGSHGRGTLYKHMLGSVSEEVMAARSLPILVVPLEQS